jgi:hypothetical protein
MAASRSRTCVASSSSSQSISREPLAGRPGTADPVGEFGGGGEESAFMFIAGGAAVPPFDGGATTAGRVARGGGGADARGAGLEAVAGAVDPEALGSVAVCGCAALVARGAADGGRGAAAVSAKPSVAACFCASALRSDGGGGGSALVRGALAGARVEFFLPNPSNTSRSEPPLLSPAAMSADLL